VLPKLKNEEFNLKKLDKPVNVKELSEKDKKIYKGFELYLNAKKKVEQLKNSEQKQSFDEKIRAGFFVEWDPQSFYSLQNHIDKLNMLFAEWFFIDPVSDTLVIKIDSTAFDFIKQYPLKILPILSNVDYRKGNGSFLGEPVHRIFHDEKKRDDLINSIVNALEKYKFQGLNIDLEELKEDGDEPMIGFVRKLHEKLKEKNLLLTQDIMAGNDDFNVPALQSITITWYFMAYDQHYSIAIQVRFRASGG
jgi:spore germination protein YaaH